MPRRFSLGRGALLVAMSSVATGARAGPDPFAGCAAQFAARPDDYASSYCFFQVAEQGKRWGEAARRLDALRAGHPRNFWLTLARGNVEWTRDPASAEALYREAADGFAKERLAEGEVLARQNLRTLLYRKGRLEEAGREVDRAVAVAESSGQELVIARALTLQALQLTDTGRDLAGAYRALRRAQQAAFPDGPYSLRRSILFALGNVCFQLGRLDEALEHYRRVATLTEENRDALTLASARYNVVNTLFRQLEELPRPGGREELVGLAREALPAAVAADNRETQAMLHRTLGELLGADPATRVESRAHYEQCTVIARSIRQPRELAHCLWSLARDLAVEGRAAEARQRIDEALALVRETGHVWSISHASRQRMRVSWETRPREEAIAESLASLDAIEAVRRLQDEQAGSAQVLSAWAADYHWLAGHLLGGGEGGRSREDLERAFTVVERMRARALLDSLSEARLAPGLPAEHPLVVKRRALLQKIVDTHRDLLDPSVEAPARRALLDGLDALELQEQDVRRALRASRPHLAAYEAPRLARLAEVEAQLDPREALLSYEVGLTDTIMGQSEGGAWVTVSTRSGTVAHPIPDRVRLQAVVPVFLGLFDRRDGREALAATSLFHDLLRPALSALPAQIERLVVVPDDLLHRVPFAALRESVGGEPLGARFEVTVVPSATLWLRWREDPVRPTRPALVLADPTLPTGNAGVPAATREWAFTSEGRLGPLPFARQEGRSVARVLDGSTLWLGDAASEDALKKADLDNFGLLHFAAHAVADEERPERSAILLAPGSAGEDGLLQAREIAELPLEGRVVVLSACRSASGSVLRGEGVLSLARAFFQGGAPAVVGSLWPLRDDEAAKLFDSFYRHLAEGLSLSAAVRGALREAIAADRPAAAWAGLVVVGDGSRVLYPGGTRPRLLSAELLLALAGGLAAVLVFWALRRRG